VRTRTKRMGRGGDRALSRRPHRREPRVKITIFSEGAVTEPDYLGRFAAEVRVKLLFGKKGGKPADLVEAAIAARRATRSDGFSGDHEIWAVFDRDDHPHTPELRRRAAENGVRVAFSEPCFEIWALLHRPDGLGPMTSREAIERVCAHLPSYRREKRLDYDALRPHHDAAVARAERLRAAREQDGGTNPYTDVDVLLRLVRDNGKP